jgi:protein tyrosine phosphatase
VLPLASSCVKLKKLDGQDDSDYINANYVYDDLNNDLSKKQLYICCQAPLVSTFDDFWRMTWEQSMPAKEDDIVCLLYLFDEGCYSSDSLSLVIH